MKIKTDTISERDKFIAGAEYWTFYMELNTKGTALRYVVKVFKTKLLKTLRSSGQIGDKFLNFSVPEDLKVSDTMRRYLPHYMNGYGSARCDFYTSKEEAIEAFDKTIEEFATYQKASDRDKMLKKRYVQRSIKLSTIEIEAEEWRDKLTDKEKSYLDWFIKNN